MDKRKLIFVALGLIFASLLAYHGRISQNSTYHLFADTRTFLGIPNLMDVLSNSIFVLAGIRGLCFSWSKSAKKDIVEIALFLGITLTGLGSAYYHYSPNNDSLLWDRLPMTLVFMSYLSLLVDIHIIGRKTLKLFYSFLALGLFSILYWHISSLYGQDDLRIYVFVQFYPVLSIPTIFILYPSSRSGLKYVLLTFAFYVLAKFFESADLLIYNAVGISGHSLKHIAAGIATWYIYQYVAYLSRLSIQEDQQLPTTASE